MASSDALEAAAGLQSHTTLVFVLDETPVWLCRTSSTEAGVSSPWLHVRPPLLALPYLGCLCWDSRHHSRYGGGNSWSSSHHHTGSHSLLGLSLQVLIHDGPLSPPPTLHAVTQFSQVPKRHRKIATGGAYTKGDIGLRILTTRPLSQLFLSHVPP